MRNAQEVGLYGRRGRGGPVRPRRDPNWLWDKPQPPGNRRQGRRSVRGRGDYHQPTNWGHGDLQPTNWGNGDLQPANWGYAVQQPTDWGHGEQQPTNRGRGNQRSSN